MEEVIDSTNVTCSPEELAIHFLLRHAACRKALTGPTIEDRLHEALARSRPETPIVEALGARSHQPHERVSRASTPVAEVTENDSCAARFSKAYAAARHNPAQAVGPRMARTG
jgi:predicted aldo/keto reductase-like oxidoreductase